MEYNDVRWFDKLYFANPTLLGDAFVVSAIVHYFAERSTTLYYPSTDASFNTLKCLYSETPNIVVMRADEYYEHKNATGGSYIEHWPFYIRPLHLVGSEPVNVSINWDRQIYEHFDLPFSLRYRNNKFPKRVEGSYELYMDLTGGVNDYAVINRTFHKDNHIAHHMSYEQYTGDLRVIEITPGITDNLLQFVDLIVNAKQFHTLQTSILHMVDSIWDRMSSCQLYYHEMRSTGITQINSKYNGCVWNHVFYPHLISLTRSPSNLQIDG